MVGNSGSGKSTLGRQLADGLGVPFVELDGIFHLPGWTELPREEFRARVAEVVAADGWVVDGNYSAVREVVWERADTVVFLDLPRRTVMRSVIVRSTGRVVGRRELWNGNREQLRGVLGRQSIIGWAWTQHTKYRRRYTEAMADLRWSHLTFVHLTGRRQVRAWLAALPRR